LCGWRIGWPDVIGRSRAIGAVLVAASVLALAMSAYSSLKSRAFAECQAQVNEALIVAQNARADAAEQDRASDRDESIATAELIRAVFASTAREQTRAAYDAYTARLGEINAQRAKSEAQRQAHPLPAPPSLVCG
jgi:hypothetical protein